MCSQYVYEKNCSIVAIATKLIRIADNLKQYAIHQMCWVNCFFKHMAIDTQFYISNFF
jgi:hypothetical protein